MWNKVKTVFSIIGAFLSVVFFTSIFFFIRRNSADGTRSTGDTERDSRIQEGIESGERRTNTIEKESAECNERIANAENRITRCEEHLRRAEEILRNAVKRGTEEE